MATRRTTLILDDEAGEAARQLARRYHCSISEAIRRSLIAQRDAETGISRQARKERSRALRRLFVLFEDNDAGDEIRRLKSEDQGF